MRKLIVNQHISLDGVIQAPGSKDEDTSNGFNYGGWISSYADEVSSQLLRKQMSKDFDLLLGRKTYELWAPHWSAHKDAWPKASKATKYVVSNSITIGKWDPTVFLSGDIIEKITELKKQSGQNLHLWGSSHLLQTLLKLLVEDLSCCFRKREAVIC